MNAPAPPAEPEAAPTLPEPSSMNASALRSELKAAGVHPDAKASTADLRAAVVLLRDAAALAAAENEDPEPVVGEIVDEPAPGAAAQDEPVAAVEPNVEEVEDEVGKMLALREASVAPALGLPTPQEFNAALAVAEKIANSRVVPDSYRGRPDDVLAAILFGRELGLGPMVALRDVHMIDGRAAVAAHRQLGILRRDAASGRGVVILASEATDERGYIYARRTDTGEEMEVEFTWEDAQKIVRKGKALVDGDNWKNYRKDMLWARTVGRLSRRLASDMMGGLPPYVAEEVADFSGWGVEYGAEGEVQFGVRQPARETRDEFPDYNFPESWAELMPRLGALIGDDDATEWVRQATKEVTGEDSMSALPVAKRRMMFRKVCLALAALDLAGGGDLLFDTDRRKIVAEAFAPRLEGTLLPGPPWRLSPTETDRLPREEWLAANPPAEAPAVEAAAAEAAPAAGADGDTEHERMLDMENEAMSADERAAEADSAPAFQPTAEELAEAEQMEFGPPEETPGA